MGSVGSAESRAGRRPSICSMETDKPGKDAQTKTRGSARKAQSGTLEKLSWRTIRCSLFGHLAFGSISYDSEATIEVSGKLSNDFQNERSVK